MQRDVFIISDGTGITAESLVNSLLSQFEHITFNKNIIPYIDSIDKLNSLIEKIKTKDNTGKHTLVFTTFVNRDFNLIVNQLHCPVFDLFNTFLSPLEKVLGTKSTYMVGKTHGLPDLRTYNHRIDAIDYTLAHDDGLQTHDYNKADIILIGVSRSGKTPSCLYMALQFGILAANYPFTEEDLSNFQLPATLRANKHLLFGLTIDPERLQQIRFERRPNSNYSSLQQCKLEISAVENMYKTEKIPFLNSTRYSIEEISTKIMSTAMLKRKL